MSTPTSPSSHTPTGVVVVVADPDPTVRSTLTESLRYLGYDARQAHDGESAARLVERHRPAVLVAELALGDIDGFTLLRRLRRRGHDLPTVYLAARDQREDRLTALDLGRGDYVVKPFDLDEVVLRVANLVGAGTRSEGPRALRYADLLLDEGRHEVWRGERLVELTPTEFELLRHLLRNAGLVVTRQQLLEEVWGYDFGGISGAVDSCVRHLRRKLGAGSPEAPDLIATVRGYGYSLRLPRPT